MLRETGVVTRLDETHAWVASAGQKDCARCAAGQGCGGGILARLLGERLYQVRAATGNLSLSVGDRVVLGLAPAALVRGSILSYGLPLAGLLLGAGLLARSGEVPAMLGALAGLVAGVVLGRIGAGRLNRDARLQPIILGRLPADPGGQMCLRRAADA